MLEDVWLPLDFSRTGIQSFVESVLQEIIQLGTQGLMDSHYFVGLREGELFIQRIREWALQHYLHNVGLCKGFALCIAKNAHDSFLYDYFSKQLGEDSPIRTWPSNSDSP